MSIQGKLEDLEMLADLTGGEFRVLLLHHLGWADGAGPSPDFSLSGPPQQAENPVLCVPRRSSKPVTATSSADTCRTSTGRSMWNLRVGDEGEGGEMIRRRGEKEGEEGLSHTLTNELTANC